MAEFASSRLTLKQVQNELKDVTDWYPLGVQLGIQSAILKQIEEKYPRNPERCKLEVFQFWLDNAPDPSWGALLVAVEAMGTHDRLVRMLRRSYGDDIRSEPSLDVCEESSDSSPLNGATPAVELASKSNYCNGNGISSTENLYTKLQDEPPVAGCIPTGSDCDESDLEVETDKIMLKFGALVTRVRIALEQLGVTVENLASHLETVKGFEPVHAQSRTPLLLDCIEEVRTQENLGDAFRFILDYFSWFNYLLIENIIEAFCKHNKDIQDGLDEYIGQFKEYCKNRLSKCPKNGFGFGRKKDASILVVKVDHKWEVARVNQVAYVRDAVARVLGVKKQALYLRTVKNGCIELTFLVPKFVGDAVSLINPDEIADALRSIGVLELHCFCEQNEGQVESLLFVETRNFQSTQDMSHSQEAANAENFEPASSETAAVIISGSGDNSETESEDSHTGHNSYSSLQLDEYTEKDEPDTSSGCFAAIMRCFHIQKKNRSPGREKYMYVDASQQYPSPLCPSQSCPSPPCPSQRSYEHLNMDSVCVDMDSDCVTLGSTGMYTYGHTHPEKEFTTAEVHVPVDFLSSPLQLRSGIQEVCLSKSGPVPEFSDRYAVDV